MQNACPPSEGWTPEDKTRGVHHPATPELVQMLSGLASKKLSGGAGLSSVMSPTAGGSKADRVEACLRRWNAVRALC